jgi:hypothetical protein
MQLRRGPSPRPPAAVDMGSSQSSSSSSSGQGVTGRDGNHDKSKLHNNSGKEGDEDGGDHAAAASITKATKEDCPACEEYTAGPCGTQFQAWLDCTNCHEDDYEEKCKSQFNAFHNCLQWQWQHTTMLEDYMDDEDEEGL